MSLAVDLCQKITAFLVSCGGTYSETAELQISILTTLAARQFVIKMEGGEIIWFASWWRITPEALETVRAKQQPLDICNGKMIYVVEAGNKGGRKGMAEMVAAIHRKNPDVTVAVWHRGDRFKRFKLVGEVGRWE